MSVFVNGKWDWYRPEWPREYRAYVDQLRKEGAQYQMTIVCSKCHNRHMDPHINGCASARDQQDVAHTPDWGTL